MISELFSELEGLYKELPPVSCYGCGACCVSPDCTLLEFAYLLRGVASLPEEQLKRFVLTAPEKNTVYDGNLTCKLLDNGRCALHPARTGACRIFGTSTSIDRGVADLVVCVHGIEKYNKTDPAVMQKWLDALMALNNRVFPVSTSPYFLVGLNLESWLDIYFDESLNFDIFAPIRAVMHEAADIARFAPAYVARTGIKEKIDRISLLTAMMGVADAATLREVLVSVRDGFPLTGTWFQAEAQAMLDQVNETELRMAEEDG